MSYGAKGTNEDQSLRLGTFASVDGTFQFCRQPGRAVAQAVSRRLPTAVARLRFQVM
jgi:hypothetical protein